MQERILANMSQRGAEMLREEMEFMPPQRRSVVEEAQSKIVAVVRRLEDAGEIVISRGGERRGRAHWLSIVRVPGARGARLA